MIDKALRRGGRARLKASDSKSDRGVIPSVVQILSPPPYFFAEVAGTKNRRQGRGSQGENRRGGRVAEGAALEMPCTGNCTVGSNPTPSANSGFAVRRLRTRRSAVALSRREIPLAVLDGEVAVPCSPQSAIAALN